MVEAYRKVGRHDQAWDATALRYLEACSHTSAGMPDARTPEALAHEGQALWTLAAPTPWWNITAVLIFLIRGSVMEARRMYLLRAVDGFRSSRYPYARRRFAPTRLAEIDSHEFAMIDLPHAELVREQLAMKALALQWLGESLRDGSYTNSEQRLFFA